MLCRDGGSGPGPDHGCDFRVESKFIRAPDSDSCLGARAGRAGPGRRVGFASGPRSCANAVARNHGRVPAARVVGQRWPAGSEARPAGSGPLGRAGSPAARLKAPFPVGPHRLQPAAGLQSPSLPDGLRRGRLDLAVTTTATVT